MKQITEHLSPFSWFRDVQHIGSTSIPDMAAKPLVDLMLGCDKLASLEEVSSQLISLGFEKLYQYKPTRFLCKDNPDFGVSVCIVKYQDAYWRTRILFRDYFADHPEEIDIYQI